MSRTYAYLPTRNPISVFDNNVKFYDYIVIDKKTQRIESGVPINVSTGELGGPLPPFCEVANHRYFYNNRPVRGSVTALAYFDKFDAEVHSRRIATETRILLDETYKYYQFARAELEARWPELRRAHPLLCATAAEHYAQGVASGPAYREFRTVHDPHVQAALKAAWDKTRDDAAESGTEMHNTIQAYYENAGGDLSDARFATPEFAQFQRFQREWVERRGLKIYRTELSMYDPYAQLCGTIDAVYEHSREPNGTINVVLADWKRTTKLETRSFSGKDYGRPPFSDWQACKTSERWLQLLTYGKMLQDNTAGRYRVVSAHIVAFHSDAPDYVVMDVPSLAAEAARMQTVFDELHAAKLVELDAERKRLLAEAGQLVAFHGHSARRLVAAGLTAEQQHLLAATVVRITDIDAQLDLMCATAEIESGKKRKQ